MTHDDVVDVLAKAAAYDRRKVGEVDVLAWHEIIGRYDRGEALAAVTLHYTETREWMMPADLVRHIKALREDGRRVEHSDALALPSRYETDEERDERNKAARARLNREVLEPLAAKRSVERALREQETNEAIESARARFAAGSEWQVTPNAKTGVWWDDPAARERHCQELLAS